MAPVLLELMYFRGLFMIKGALLFTIGIILLRYSGWSEISLEQNKVMRIAEFQSQKTAA